MNLTNHKKPIGNGVKIMECPNCGYFLEFPPKEIFLKCPHCFSDVGLFRKASKDEKQSDRVERIYTIEAAQAYLKLLFEKYDWNNFIRNPERIRIEEADRLTSNMRMIHGDDPRAWRLSFDCLALFIEKKVRFSNICLNNIINDYLQERESDYEYRFTVYQQSLKTLLASRDLIEKELSKYIENAERFGIDDEGNQMKEDLKKIRNFFANMKIRDRFADLPVIAEANEKKLREKEKHYSDLGIDAPAVYRDALLCFANGNRKEADDGFRKIPDYKDSSVFLKKINEISIFDRRVYCLNNGFYCYDKKLFPLKSKLIDYAHPLTGDFDGSTAFVNFCFYYRDPKEKCVFRYLPFLKESPEKHKEQDRLLRLYGEPRLLTEKDNVIQPDRLVFLIKYNPRNQKDRLSFFKNHHFGVPKPFDPRLKLPILHDLITYNPENGEFVLIRESIMSVSEYKGNFLVYKAREADGNPKEPVLLPVCLYLYDTEKNEVSMKIHYDAEIRYRGKDNKTIFSVSERGNGNYTVYRQDGTGLATAMLENVREKIIIYNNRIFYQIGWNKESSLCSVALDGVTSENNPWEVMKGIDDVVACHNGYIYSTRGANDRGYRTLYRISENSPETKVAFGINKDDLRDGLPLCDDLLCYINHENILCRVFLNGEGYRELTGSAKRIVCLKSGKIYYLRYENNQNGDLIESLYVIGTDGNNHRKLIYDLSEIDMVGDYSMYSAKEKLSLKTDLYREIDDPKTNKKVVRLISELSKIVPEPCLETDVVYLYDMIDETSEKLFAAFPYPDKKGLENVKRTVSATLSTPTAKKKHKKEVKKPKKQ